LIPNLGYCSEAAASLVDRHLFGGDMIVPWTEIASLASPSFYYSYIDKRNAKRTGKLPEKIGSFQIFMRGYKDAIEFLKEAQEHTTTGGLTKEVEMEFQADFEKLVVLDYIIRNTGKCSASLVICGDSMSPAQIED